MKYLSPLLVISCISLTTSVLAQTKIKDNTITGTSALPNSAAILELESSNKGLLLPRVNLVTTSSWSPLVGSPVIGMTVYNTSATITSSDASYPLSPSGIGSYYWDGTGWVAMAYSSPANVPTIYTADGSLPASRTVTLGANTLKFYNSDATAGGYVQFQATTGPNLLLSANSATGSANIALDAGGTGLFLQNFGGNSSQISSTSTVGLDINSSSSSSNIRFFDNGSQRMIINSTGNVGIGSIAQANSTLQVLGSVSTNIVVVTGSYTALSTDHTIVFNTTAAGAILTLPDPTTCQGRVYVLVNFADAVNIGIAPAAPIYAFSGGTITNLPTDNGSSSGNLVMGNRVTIQSTGTLWIVISAG